jgi:hypothetical protein
MIEKEDVVAIIYELRKMVNMSPFFQGFFYSDAPLIQISILTNWVSPKNVLLRRDFLFRHFH